MGEEQRLTENFCCMKCRGRAAVARTIILSNLNGGSLKKFFMPEIDKYYLLTCALCGFTEIYDSRAYATAAEAKPEAQPLPQEL